MNLKPSKITFTFSIFLFNLYHNYSYNSNYNYYHYLHYIYIYLYTYIPRPAGWVKFLPPPQAKRNIVASEISAVSAKNFRFNCLAGFLQGQLPFLHFSHFSDIHTPWRTLADM